MQTGPLGATHGEPSPSDWVVSSDELGGELVTKAPSASEIGTVGRRQGQLFIPVAAHFYRVSAPVALPPGP